PFNRVVPESEKVFGMDKTDWWESRGELPGMFNWAIAGLRRLREQKRFTTSKVCQAALNKYRAESNPAGMFLKESYKVDPSGTIATQEVYAEYVSWCERYTFRAMAVNSFGTEIMRAFPLATKAKTYTTDLHPRRVPGYAGVIRKSPEEQEADDEAA